MIAEPERSRWPNILMVGVAAIAFFLLARRAIFNLDTAGDALAYHLPFAARYVGLCDDDCYEFLPIFDKLFRSFPPLPDWLLGIFWRLTGRPEGANFVALTSLMVLTIYIWRFLKVPWGLAVISLLAIPVVQVFATSSYIDLTVNAAASICILSIFNLAMYPGRFGWPSVAAFCASLVFLGNAKLQMFGISALCGIAFVVLTSVSRDTPVHGFWRVHWRNPLGIAAILLLGLATAYSGIHNFITFGNPVYPVQVSLLGFQLPGLLEPIAANSRPAYLADAPGPVAWLLSVLEFKAFDARHTPWTLGQADIPVTTDSYRMGGYFGVYVLLIVSMFWFASASSPRRERWIARSFVMILSLFTAIMPAANELRYYMFWMICLVTITLHLALANTERTTQRLIVAIVICCGAYVTILSGGRFFRMGGGDAEAIVNGLGVRAEIDAVKDGATMCVKDKLPLTFLYAKVFHPGRNYRTIERIECPDPKMLQH
jgi:hypothetical protein